MDREPDGRRREARGRRGTRVNATHGARAGVSNSLWGRKTDALQGDRDWAKDSGADRTQRRKPAAAGSAGTAASSGREMQPREDVARGEERTGHRREYDGRGPQRSFKARIDGVVRDVGMFRVVALKDVVARQFDEHPFAGRQGVAVAERRGWVKRLEAQGPTGGTYAVLLATPSGAARAAALWREEDRPGQRAHSGAVKLAELGHEVAVYRAVNDAQDRIEAAGGRVTRVRIDAELKGLVAARGERARSSGGAVAAVERRCQAAEELGLPVREGRVLVPDAQLEYETAAGDGARCNIEVASEHYNAGEIRAKAAAGFQLYAAAGRAVAVVRRALAAGDGGRRGGRGVQGEELFEL